jgi:IclR family transcriptional regulator, KDG regulon repressor
MPDGNSAGTVRSVQLAIDVLETVSFADEEMGVTQIASRLGVTKGSVFRHLHTLVERGYLAQNPATSRYAIGPKSRVLARLAPETDLVKIAEGPMRELRDALGHSAVGHSVVLSEMTPRGALVLTTLASTSPIEIGVRSGSELAFHATAQGRVMLAFAPRPFQDRILSRRLPAFTEKTVTSPDRLRKALLDIVKRGYESAPGESMLGLNALATPIFDGADACVAALAIVGSIQFIPEKPKRAHIEALTRASQQISRKLGHSSAKSKSK